MSKKRNATSDLNHENWDADEPEKEPEGQYAKASAEELKTRVIRTAKRRIQPTNESETSDTTKGLFSNIKFTSTPATATPDFSFLSKIVPSNGSSALDANKKEIKQKLDSKEEKKSALYITKLKELNKTVASWIKLKVDANASCILTPIFKDYEMYLKTIEENEDTEAAAPVSKSYSFSAANAEMKAADKTTTEAGLATKTTTTTTSMFHGVGSFKFGSLTKPTTIGGATPFGSSAGLSTSPKIQFGFGSQISTSPSGFGNQISTASSGFGSQISAAPSGFSFGGSKPFTLGNVAPPASSVGDEGKKTDEDEDEVPKVEFVPVEEEGSFFTKRCKFFVKSKEAFADKGIGTLHLKPVEGNDKTQMIIRADNSLGTILLNIILAEAIPTKRMGKNNVMMVCNPTPQDVTPVSVLIRVKTEEEADALLETIIKHKK